MFCYEFISIEGRVLMLIYIWGDDIDRRFEVFLLDW